MNGWMIVSAVFFILFVIVLLILGNLIYTGYSIIEKEDECIGLCKGFEYYDYDYDFDICYCQKGNETITHYLG